MGAVTIRNIPDDTHEALKARAARNGRSTEAEIRHILQEAVRPAPEYGLGSELAAIGRRFNVTTEFENLRDQAPAEPIVLE